MMKIIKFVFVFVIIFFTNSYAATTGIHYQGKLTDTSGVPINASKQITFKLYNVASGGSAIWTLVSPNVTVTNGHFAVFLDIPNAQISTDDMYLGVQVAADSEMTPRMKFAAVPIAYKAMGLTSGSLVNADVSTNAAIDAAKIANGTVSNTEYQYLDGVTSALQTQLGNKQGLNANLTSISSGTWTGAASITTVGTLPSLNVTNTVNATAFVGNGSLLTGVGVTANSITSTQIMDGSIVNADVSTNAAIDATKIANGTVSNTEFQYLDGVTSALQTQLTNKQASNANLTSISSGTWTGATSITSLGTIATGTWNATALTDAKVADNLTISAGTIENSPIGQTTPAQATFTTMNATMLASSNMVVANRLVMKRQTVAANASITVDWSTGTIKRVPVTTTAISSMTFVAPTTEVSGTSRLTLIFDFSNNGTTVSFSSMTLNGATIRWQGGRAPTFVGVQNRSVIVSLFYVKESGSETYYAVYSTGFREP